MLSPRGCDVIWTPWAPSTLRWLWFSSEKVRKAESSSAPLLRDHSCGCCSASRGEGDRTQSQGPEPSSAVQSTKGFPCCWQSTVFLYSHSWSATIQPTLSPLSMDGGGLIHFEDLSNYGCVMSVYLSAGALKRPEAADPRS